MPIGHELIIANTAEAFAAALGTVASECDRAARVKHEHSLSIRSLLWSGDDKIVVVPSRPVPELVEHLRSVAEYENIEILYPRRCDISLCEAVSHDSVLLERLRELSRTRGPLRVSPYVVSTQFIGLLIVLRNAGVQFLCDVAKEPGDVWIARYLDSKAGFRSEVGAICPQPRIPSGFICADHSSALDAVAWFTRRNLNCIVKADQGESGWGLHFVKAECHALNDTANAIRSNKLYGLGPLVIEEWIGTRPDQRLVSPSAELYVNDTGAFLTYICAQLVNENGEFAGVIMGPDIPDEPHRSEIQAVSARLGKRFFDLGVRGHFDIDFIVSNSGGLYAVETNVRRTGGTHVFDLKMRLGCEFTDCYFLSEDNYTWGTNIRTPQEIMDCIRPILFSRRIGEGVVITLLPPDAPRMGYILISPSYDKLLSLRERLHQALS